jgi:hypothetical protein
MVPLDNLGPERETMFDKAILARYAILGGRRDLAAEIVDSMAAEADRFNYPDGFEPFMETLIDLGRDDQMGKAVEAARRMSTTSVLLGPLADRAEASVARGGGDVDRARRLLETAVARFDELGSPFEAARTREELAALIEEPRRSELLSQALEEYERLRAVPFIERVRAQLS